jgi:hypothetical protein
MTYEPLQILGFDLILREDPVLASLHMELDLHEREAFVFFFIRQQRDHNSFWGTYSGMLVMPRTCLADAHQCHPAICIGCRLCHES